MKISIVTFDDFTDLDLFILWDLLKRVEEPNWRVEFLQKLLISLKFSVLRNWKTVNITYIFSLTAYVIYLMFDSAHRSNEARR